MKHGAADFADLQLRDHRVQLRPKYVTETSVFPVSVAYPFRVTAVHGKRRDGGLHCVLPTLGLRFTYQRAIRWKHCWKRPSCNCWAARLRKSYRVN